jgi:hypothetical protein
MNAKFEDTLTELTIAYEPYRNETADLLIEWLTVSCRRAMEAHAEEMRMRKEGEVIARGRGKLGEDGHIIVNLKKGADEAAEKVDNVSITTFIEPEELAGLLTGRRAQLAISWREMARRVGVSPSTLTRLRTGHCPSARGYIAILAFMRKDGSVCGHDRYWLVGGVGTVEKPPRVRRVCVECGEEL